MGSVEAALTRYSSDSDDLSWALGTSLVICRAVPLASSPLGYQSKRIRSFKNEHYALWFANPRPKLFMTMQANTKVMSSRTIARKAAALSVRQKHEM